MKVERITYSIEHHGIDSVVLVKRYSRTGLSNDVLWYSPKDDKWWNFEQSDCIFHHFEDCKIFYDKFVAMNGKTILVSTEIKEKTVGSALIKLIEKLIERL